MKTNVLIFPDDSLELHDALSNNVNVRLHAACSIERHGAYIYKNYRSDLPFISEDNFIKKLNTLIEEWNIDLIFPTHDTVALFLAENQDKIKSKIITSDLRTAKICRDKKFTYELFGDCNFCPTVYTKIKEFPCFIKPRDGQGGKGSYLIKSEADIPQNIRFDNYCIVEYLPGEEFTVDCLTDSHGELKAVLPRTRDRLLAGISTSSKAIRADSKILEIANTINDRLKFLGLWYFQIKKDYQGKFKLMEISMRCAGTMCLSRARGVNLPLLSVYCALGKEVSVFENPYSVKVDRALISRYKIDYEYDKIYLDYDDTLINDDEVCLPVIRFVYQCCNKGKKIILLTRHENYFDDTIEENLKSHSIAETLFNSIICVEKGKEKFDYMTMENSIFIDNAYAERKKVHDLLNIPVFDVEGIEVLLDWRC